MALVSGVAAPVVLDDIERSDTAQHFGGYREVSARLLNLRRARADRLTAYHLVHRPIAVRPNPDR